MTVRAMLAAVGAAFMLGWCIVGCSESQQEKAERERRWKEHCHAELERWNGEAWRGWCKLHHRSDITLEEWCALKGANLLPESNREPVSSGGGDFATGVAAGALGHAILSGKR